MHPSHASRSGQDTYVSKCGSLGDLGPSVLFGDSQTTPGPFYRAGQLDRSDLKMFHYFLSSFELRRPSSTNFCIMKASKKNVVNVIPPYLIDLPPDPLFEHY